MEQIENQLVQVQHKAQELLKRYAAGQKQQQQQQTLIQSLREQLSASEKKIRALEEQQHILKSAAGQLTATDKKAFEQSISRYIREIDKCIALLSE